MRTEGYFSEKISHLQSELAGVDGYANHERQDIINVLGTAHGLCALGYLSAEEEEAFAEVGRIILKHAR